MKLYNTLTRQVEEIESVEDKKIKMFVCGPTVYDLSHIGHAKTYIQMDVLSRTLRAQNFDVFYLQNITDIDDKIILRAKDKNVSWKDINSKFEDEYYKDMKALNNTSVDRYEKATENIDNIKRQVQVLLDKNFAYKIENDGIYFEIAKFKDYGKLSKRTELVENDAQSRIDQSDKKRGWNDFCLWKFSKPGEPVWEADFGKGRPGWHIEDTAISEKVFGPQYDIHGGAVDLIFPHHEAEITQMEAASGKSPFVRYWVHSGFLNIDGQRMGKSKGNFVTIREVLKKGYEPMSVRLLMLQSHYRSSLDFSWDILDAAQNSYRKIVSWADLRHQGFSSKDLSNDYQTYIEAFEKSMSSDLKTPEALAILNKMIKKIDEENAQPDSSAIGKAVELLDSYLGLRLLDSSDISSEQKTIIKKREEARKAKNWAESDRLREELTREGIAVRDTDYGSAWSRI
ncbi:MAG TPA: cysteine--tRNA ligase [Candidatus Saccharimonadales bacterium]|nr:cysteine--tRNA ligase [Candidatus Saccharimonadales bacterium]